MEKKSKIDIHDSESTSWSVGGRGEERRGGGGGGGCVNNLCISLSEEEQTSDGVGGERSLLCQGRGKTKE